MYQFKTERKDIMNVLNKKTVEDIDVKGKKVLVRCDFNVKMEDGVITSDKRIVASLPTINYLLDHGAKLILCSHLGRPKGEFKPEFSLAPVAKRLGELLGKEVKMAKDVVGESAQALAADLKEGEVLLLENVRFHAEETKNDPEFAKKLASLAEIYVNDAFGSAHRAHASTTGVADYITNLMEKVDTLIVGGGMAYTFFKALGHSVGTSLLEADKVDLAKEMMDKAAAKGVKFLIPIDNVIGKEYKADTEYAIVDSDDIPDGWMGLDIGPKSTELFATAVKDAGTVIWNGPMGVSEWEHFANGTIGVATAIAESNAISIIGGGDSAAAIQKLGFADKMSHISTGGGASLEFLEGKELPGVAALNDKD